MSKRSKTSNTENKQTEISKDMTTTQKTIEEKYQKKTQKEHILLRPDTYIGDISLQTESLWVYDRNNKKIIKKEISYVPGLYKIFDEILVNARDHTVSDHTCDTIKVEINQENNTISVWNNGKGIDIEMHQEHNMWVPEMIFGELLTSTNYDDNEKRTTGGRNGYGAKLTNIFSIYFQVETVDLVRKRKFVQEWTNNMNNKSEAKITELKGENIKSYTKITFRPDLTKFKLKELTDDMVNLMEKRVIDIAGVSGKIKVHLNGIKLDINNFKKYISYYDIPQLSSEYINDNNNEDTLDDKLDLTETSETVHETKNKDDRIMYEEYGRWRIGIVYTPDNGFEQISFVNGICTYHGGSHVDYVVNNIVKKLETMILKKSKDAKIKPNQIKDNLMVFIDSIIENPAFTSQTKETLKTKISDFGSTCDITDKFVKKIGSSGIVDQVVNLAMMKEQAILKKTDGKKVQSLKGIPKLEDAEWAGTKKSELCYLILTEGDSAKAMAMAGRDVIGSERFGIFPLKGKLLNVREASPKQLLENEEITNLKKILGLQHEKEYTDKSQLRYGGIISLCDQDHDGSHIKGLLLNFLHYFWPSLMKLGTFIYSLATPIIKATKNKEIKTFYNLTEYDRWKQETPNVKQWAIKYYKGLGTSDRNEAKEYFTDIDNKLVRYVASVLLDQQIDEVNEDEELNEEIKENNEEKIIDFNKITELSQTQTFKIKEKYKDPCDEAITLAFEKKRSDDRKIWLLNYNKNNILYNDQKLVTINEFVNKELIHFSNDDINRSIPSVVDGFKPSTRKILYGSILRKLFNKKDEIKVSQLAGFVSDKSCYHHGEASLIGAIVGMAQNFVGSNNINVLYPSGQFGTRMTSKDFASPRYIFTYLAELTRLIFRPEDEPILNYLDDDGTYVEPEYYVPIIPMILVNGGEGIGTGFSTYIPSYDPLKIIDNIINLMKNKELENMKPYYRNFRGTIDLVSDKEFKITGNYNIIGEDEIEITELPIGLWTSPYKQFIEELYDKKQIIADFNSASCTDEKISIKLKLFDGLLEKMECNGTLMSKLKLISRENTSNMHLYNSSGQIRKYHNPESILKEFYGVRLNYYTKRKEYLIGKLNKELNILKYKVMFIEYVLDKKIIIERQKKINIINKLIELKFPKLADSNDDESYDYLTEMSLFSLTEEKIDELNNRYKNKEEELKRVQSTSEIDQWMSELNEFKNEYIKWIEKHKIDYSKQVITKTKSKLISKSVEEPVTKKKAVKKALIKK